eukprot:jgi/Tetstr1/434370/TSEL_023472.t2
MVPAAKRCPCHVQLGANTLTQRAATTVGRRPALACAAVASQAGRPMENAPAAPSGAAPQGDSAAACNAVGAQAAPVEKFRWFRHWYPIHVVECLDPAVPHAVQLFGCSLVLWRDGNSQWQCFDDVCPHRLAPLSEGRIEADGRLHCAYHGWAFDGCGQCAAVPQARPLAAFSGTESHKAGKRWAAWTGLSREPPMLSAYPTREAAGLVWVWPGTGAEARREADATPLRGFGALFDETGAAEGRVVRSAWTLRDTPISWDYIMENACDPASHRAAAAGGESRKAEYFDMRALRDMSAQEGFEFSLDPELVPSKDAVTRSTADFRPPCLVRRRSQHASGAESHSCLLVVPTSPGRCRQIACQVAVQGSADAKPKQRGSLQAWLPTWLAHVLSSPLNQRDLAVLLQQERTAERMREVSGVQADRLYTTPTPADRMALAFRAWFSHHSSGGIPWAPGTADSVRPSDPAALNDAYASHTQHCRVCQAALRRVGLLQRLTAAAATGAAALAATLYAAACASKAAVAAAPAANLRRGSEAALAAVPYLYAPPPGCVALALLALALGAAHLALATLKPRFFRYDSRAAACRGPGPG